MLALTVGGSHAMAQSLGQIQVKSTMDQPLLAEIPLTDTTGNGRIEAALASSDDFSRAGLDRSKLPQDLKFAVTTNAQGQSVVRVTSASPIRDTYLDFLVELRSGSGKVVREVTMLLDPPHTAAAPVSSGKAAPAAPAAASRPAAPVASSESPKPAAAPRPRAAAAPAALKDGNYGPVQRGQTLSAIAKEMGGGASMNQMLIALQKANPDAFYRDNVNALKTGAVLRAPGKDDLAALDAATALAEVRRQNEEWRSGAARSPAVVADAAATEKPSSPKSAAASSDRLAIVPAKDGGDSASTGAAGGKATAAVAALRQEIASSKEALTSLKQQGDELKSRIDDLQGINDKNQRLLSLKDAEIAELQRKLADARKAGGQPAVAATSPTAAAATPAPAPAAPASTPAPVVAAVATPNMNTPAPGATVATAPLKEAAPVTPVALNKPAVPVKKPVAHPIPVMAEEPWYMQPWAWAVGGGAVVVLLLVGLLGRRKKPVAAAAGPSLADRFDGGFDEFGDEGMDSDQRELLDLLAENPDDIGLHLELVSLYYGRRDVEHFEAAAEAMYAHVADPEQQEWREVVRMGEDLAPSHPLFGGQPRTEEEEEALEEFDLDKYVAETGPNGERNPSMATPLKHSEYHFNFDLSPRQNAEAEANAAARLAGDTGHIDGLETPPVDHFDDLSSLGPNEPPPLEFAAPAAPAPAGEIPSTWRFDEPEFTDAPSLDPEGEGFSDDPVDTKLDLARAYLDMGDSDGARAMLEEVMAEGSQMQKDTARRILADIG
jgi:pilus assembly protein FimV